MEKKNIDWGNIGFGYIYGLQICVQLQGRQMG